MSFDLFLINKVLSQLNATSKYLILKTMGLKQKELTSSSWLNIDSLRLARWKQQSKTSKLLSKTERRGTTLKMNCLWSGKKKTEYLYWNNIDMKMTSCSLPQLYPANETTGHKQELTKHHAGCMILLTRFSINSVSLQEVQF